MCGIFGFVNGSGGHKLGKAKLLFEELMMVDTLRGADGAGVVVVPEGKDTVYVYKRGLWGPEFLCTNGYRKGISNTISNARVAIGHNRAASTAGRAMPSDENSHPFINRHITLVHNGFIQNAYAITPKGFGPDVDSEAAAFVLAEHGEKEGLEKLRGPFALAWWNDQDKTFNLARNEGREMHCIYLKDMNTMFYASEWMMLHLVLKRNDMSLDGKYRVVAPFNHLKFNISNPREYTRTPFVKPQEYQSSHTGQNASWGQGGQTGHLNTELTTNSQPSTGTSPETTTTSPAAVSNRRSLSPSISGRDLEELQSRFTILNKQHHKGGAIPTSKSKIRTAFERLASLGYRLGQTMMITVETFELYKNQKTHGSARGKRRYIDPKQEHRVLMPNMSRGTFDKLRNARSVYVTLVNLKLEDKKPVLIGVLDGWSDADRVPYRSNQRTLTLPGGKNPPTLTEEESAKGAVSAINTETGEVIKMVKGQHGVLIPASEFLARTALGCGQCDGFVNPDHADDVRWFGDSPICHECTSDPAIVHKLWPGDVEFCSVTNQYQLKVMH